MRIGPEELIILCMLAVNSISDIRKKEILFLPTVVWAAGGVVYDIASGRDAMFIICGLIPGALLAALSAVSRQAVGAGDAVVVSAAGIWGGWRIAFLSLLIAFCVQTTFSAVYRIAGGRGKELPFVPSLCAAYVLGLLLSAG